MSISVNTLLREFSFPLDERKEQLQEYLRLLLKWNTKINLVSFRALEELYTLHIAEGLFLAKHLTDPYLVEVGAGGGMLTVPLALYGNQKDFVVLEPRYKRQVFLREVKASLGLSFSLIPDKVEAMEWNNQPRFLLRALPRWKRVVGELIRRLPTVKLCYLGSEGDWPWPVRVERKLPLPYRQNSHAWWLNVSRET